MHHLKKWLGLITVSMILSMILAACGENATTESSDPETPEEVLTVEDVLQQSIEVMVNIQSLSAEMTMNQEMELSEGDAFNSDSIMTMDMTQDPFALYQKMNMTVPEMGDIETELYMVEDGMYFKDSMEDTWFTYPDELTEELGSIQDMQMQPEEQLELLMQHSEHLTLEEDESHYIVTVIGSPDILQGFAEQLNGTINEELSAEMEQIMSMADIKELDYTLYIEKETFLQTEMDMSMVLQLSTEGESMRMQTTTHATFSNFNEIDEITVPTDIVESATEFNLDFSEFEEMNGAELGEGSDVVQE